MTASQQAAWTKYGDELPTRQAADFESRVPKEVS
jgi:hypothetical protein